MPSFFHIKETLHYKVALEYNQRNVTYYALLHYVCFPFLCWVKFCSGCFRQFFFSFGRQKKVVSGCVRQVVVLYSNDCMGICLGRLSAVVLDE